MNLVYNRWQCWTIQEQKTQQNVKATYLWWNLPLLSLRSCSFSLCLFLCGQSSAEVPRLGSTVNQQQPTSQCCSWARATSSHLPITALHLQSFPSLKQIRAPSPTTTTTTTFPTSFQNIRHHRSPEIPLTLKPALAHIHEDTHTQTNRQKQAQIRHRCMNHVAESVSVFAGEFSFIMLKKSHGGVTLTLIPVGPICVEFACFPCACVRLPCKNHQNYHLNN